MYYILSYFILALALIIEAFTLIYVITHNILDNSHTN